MLKRNLIANYIGQCWCVLMGILFIPLYIKYLGIEAYGLIGFFVIIQSWLNLLDMGMTPALTREMGRFTGGKHSKETIRDVLRTVEVIVIAVSIIIFSIVYSAADWMIAYWLKSDNLSPELMRKAIVITGFVIALRFIETVYRSVIVGLQKQELFNIINSFMSTLRNLGAVGVLAFVSPTLDVFYIWQAVASTIAIVALNKAAYDSLPKGSRAGVFSIDVMRELWVFSRGFVTMTFLNLIVTQLDKIILSKLLPLKEFGYYSVASVVAGGLFNLIGPINDSYFPKFCEMHAREDEQALSHHFHNGARFISVIVGSFAIIVIIYTNTLLSLWTRQDEIVTNVTEVLKLLIIGNLMKGFTLFENLIQLSYGWTNLLVQINTFSVIIIIPALLLIVPIYGVNSAAWLWMLQSIACMIVTSHFMFKKILIQERSRWYTQDILIPLISSFSVVLIIKHLSTDQYSSIGQIMIVLGSILLSIIASAATSFGPKIILKLAHNFFINFNLSWSNH